MVAELSTAASLVSIVDIIDHCHLPLSKAKAMVLLGCSLLVGESLPIFSALAILKASTWQHWLVAKFGGKKSAL